jgi:hypothetical protein
VVTLPPAPLQSTDLGSWFASRPLGYGLADYADANVTTLSASGAVKARPVLAHGTPAR